MIDVIAQARAPEIDFEALSPVIATAAGTILVLLVGLIRGAFVQRVLVPLLTVASFGVAIAAAVITWNPGEREFVISSALGMDTLTLYATLLFAIAGIATVLLSLRSDAVREAGAGEYFSLLLASVTGMILLAGAANLVTLFIGIELLSIPLYVLCGSLVRSERSLESGLKYLVIGSVGSATLLYGLALVYGATGSTDFREIAEAVALDVSDPLLLTGVALTATGLAFKASVAPFHQWTPDVYQGAPTPVTAFMAVATKVAAFAIILRFFGEALILAEVNWAPALAALAVITIIIGNVGAITQRSIKRLLAWSGVAQAGYLLAGVVVASELGLRATAFYLGVYLLMNLAAFAVVVARERVSEHGDDVRSFEGLGTASPVLAWCMTIAMLALAGFPATAGLWGKFYLIQATVEGGYAWLGVMIVVGSILSLVYYLRVVAAMWLRSSDVEAPTASGAVAAGGPPSASRRVRPVGGASPEADARAQPEVVVVAVIMAAATVLLGILPSPLFDAAREVGTALTSLR